MTTDRFEPTIGAREIAARLGLNEPTDEQCAVIEAPLAPRLVVAGAGAGKTETMASRVVYLVANGIAPERICGLTFTRKAAAELSGRVRERLRALRRAGLMPRQAGLDLDGAGVGPTGEPGGPAQPTLGLGQPTMSTYNAHAAQLVREQGLRLGADPDARLLTDAGRWAIAARVIEESEGLETDAALSTLVGGLLHLAGESTEHLLTSQDVVAGLDDMLGTIEGAPLVGRRKGPGDVTGRALRALKLMRQLADLLPAYAAAKAADGVIEFADQVALAARLAEFEDVRDAERARFDVVLLDEYQDTSAAQLVMLQGMYGDGFPLMAVGDPHQSIYGWRGAAAGTLAAFPQHFSHAGADAGVLSLSVAWRNDEAILHAANTLATPLREAAAIELPELRARPGAGAGRVVTEFFASERDEAQGVAALLEREWLDAGKTYPKGLGPTAAVLCRKRSQFEAITDALDAAGLPFEVVGLGGLLAVAEVVDVVSFLTAAHDPSRGDALIRLLTGPRYGLAPADLLALGAWARQLAEGDQAPSPDTVVTIDGVDGASIVAAIADPPPQGWRSRAGLSLSEAARGHCARLAADLSAVRRLTYLPLADLVGYAARVLGLDVELMARSGPAGLRNIGRLQDVARTFSATGLDQYATLGAFLDYLRAAEDQDERIEAEPPRVETERIQVMTIHGAKGLEWDIVCVPGLIAGSLPRAKKEGAGESWWSTAGALPYHLRQDAPYLPQLEIADGMDVAQLEDQAGAFRADCAGHELAEDRRLAYVAVTRAKRIVFATGSWWRSQAKTSVEPSVFLTELAAAAGSAEGAWGEAPAENPEAAAERRRSWPSDPLGTTRPAVEAGAQRVRRAMSSSPDAAAVANPLRERAEALLAERDEAWAPLRQTPPTHLTASDIVSIVRDPAGFVARRRRPMPQPPSSAARRGTTFHQWAEQHLGQSMLFVDEELDSADESWLVPDEQLAPMQRNFLATEWVSDPGRWRLVGAERDVEASLGSFSLRCRADAVFEDLSRPGHYEIVDWKTGRRPQGEELRAVLLQLAAYRVAFAQLHGLAPERVTAALCYVASGDVVRPGPDDEASAADIQELVRSMTELMARPSLADDALSLAGD